MAVAIVCHTMASTQTVRIDRYVPAAVSAAVAGGLVSTVLALVHLFAVPLGGTVGLVVYLVVWPAVGGAVAAALEAERGREPKLSGVLAGGYGALVVTLLVLLTGLAGLWTPLIHTTFGVSLWPVVFAVLVLTTITWAVFGWASGYAVRELRGE